MGGGDFKNKKMQTSQMPFQNESIYQVSSDVLNLTYPGYSLKTPSLRRRNFFYKRNFNTGFETSFVGTMDISPDT